MEKFESNKPFYSNIQIEYRLLTKNGSSDGPLRRKKSTLNLKTNNKDTNRNF